MANDLAQVDKQLSDPAATQFSREKIELLKRTICKGATDDELQLFVHACGRTGLDPFMRQIHAVKRWDSREQREVMSIQTGVDGYRVIAQRTGGYAGNDEPTYGPLIDNKYPSTATVRVYRIVAGQRCPFSATARWEEYKQTKKDGSLNPFWGRMPYLMLAKCAEALALRKAFPAELSGLYTHEEMGQADNEPEYRAPTKKQKAEAVKAEGEATTAALMSKFGGTTANVLVGEPIVIPLSQAERHLKEEAQDHEMNDTHEEIPDDQQGANLMEKPPTYKIVKLAQKEGDKKSKDGKLTHWIRYGIMFAREGVEPFWANTFDKKIHDLADIAHKGNLEVLPEIEREGNFVNVKALETVTK